MYLPRELTPHLLRSWTWTTLPNGAELVERQTKTHHLSLLICGPGQKRRANVALTIRNTKTNSYDTKHHRGLIGALKQLKEHNLTGKTNVKQ